MAFITQVASAGVLTLEGGTNKINGVTIANSATLTSETNSEVEKLDLIGAGLRTKHVIITDIKVYVTQLFFDNAGKFVRTNAGALTSLADMKAGAIHLTFLRDVDAQTVQTSFKDALKMNNVDLKNAGVTAFLAAVNDGADAAKDKSMNISLKKESDGKVTVVYENTDGDETTISGDETLFQAIFSIWLGQSADSGLETLKGTLIKGGN